MRDFLLRLRAVLTPQAVLLLAALMLIACGAAMREGENGLEARISQTLSCVEGAGHVRVVIKTRQTDGGAWSKGNGEETACGAVAVAQGADDPLVRFELERALCALLGLPPSAVSVIKGGK